MDALHPRAPFPLTFFSIAFSTLVPPSFLVLQTLLLTYRHHNVRHIGIICITMQFDHIDM